MKLRKLALLKLTSLMEKHNPTSRSGWNWGVPKFIRKIRTPDYKARREICESVNILPETADNGRQFSSTQRTFNLGQSAIASDNKEI
ncbi:rho GTPase-activating protein 7-like [Tachypleus tridentatus]|uniref:rho GTPase-activating protein 7-like n=1 Tax=Tachypleus tridentatus TaxID=6853 RepID=UPI003FD5E953